MHHIAATQWISILVAALSGFAIGSLWYGPLFGKSWIQLTGVTMEKAGQVSMALVMGGSYVLNVIGATGIAMVLGEHHGWASGFHVGAFIGFFFVATSLGVIYLFEQRPLKLWFINAGYQVLNMAAMGAAIGAWPR